MSITSAAFFVQPRSGKAPLSLLGVHDADHNLGAHANAELTKIEDGYIREVVKLQEQWGLSVVTDGDFRRRSWWTDFLLSFTGLSISYDGKTPITLINAAGEKRPIAGVGGEDKIRPRDSGLAASFKFLKSIADQTAKVTIPGPPIVDFLRDANFVPSVYPDTDAFWHNLIAAYRFEIKKLADAGCRYLQIDECMLPYLCDPRHREMSKSRGDDPDQLIGTYTWAINEIVADKPKDMMVAVHMCRGNMNAFWGGDGGYEPVAELSSTCRTSTFFCSNTIRRAPATSRRCGTRRKTRKCFWGSSLPRIRSSKAGTRSSAASTMPRSTSASGSSAFARNADSSTNVFGTEFNVDDERRKIELMVGVADEVWGA